jgi:galactose mutarotase-like enzyme
MSNYVCSSQAQIKPEAFHRTVDGSQVDLYTLKNSNGLEAKITNYGGIVVSLAVPTKARVARFTNTGPVSAWRRSTTQIRQTTRTFRRQS